MYYRANVKKKNTKKRKWQSENCSFLRIFFLPLVRLYGRFLGPLLDAQSYSQWRKEATVVIIIVTLAASGVLVVRIDFIL